MVMADTLYYTYFTKESSEASVIFQTDTYDEVTRFAAKTDDFALSSLHSPRPKTLEMLPAL